MIGKPFFDAVRGSIFANDLDQGEVDGCNALAAEFERRGHADRRWLAYILATTFHETAHTMQPIREFGGERYFFRMYDIRGARPAVAERLGNTEPGDGVRFHGRGYVQITGRRNYADMTARIGADLIADPDLAMRPDIAARIIFEGMVNGRFTGRALRDHFTAKVSDWRGARRIVNGTDRAELIAGYARKFHAALKAK